MKGLVIAIVLAVAGYFLYGFLQEQKKPEVVEKRAPVKYVKELQGNMKRASDVQKAQNLKVKEAEDQMKELMKQAE